MYLAYGANTQIFKDQPAIGGTYFLVRNLGWVSLESRMVKQFFFFLLGSDANIKLMIICSASDK